jgi:hypothetical protein
MRRSLPPPSAVSTTKWTEIADSRFSVPYNANMLISDGKTITIGFRKVGWPDDDWILTDAEDTVFLPTHCMALPALPKYERLDQKVIGRITCLSHTNAFFEVTTFDGIVLEAPLDVIHLDALTIAFSNYEIQQKAVVTGDIECTADGKWLRFSRVEGVNVVEEKTIVGLITRISNEGEFFEITTDDKRVLTAPSSDAFTKALAFIFSERKNQQKAKITGDMECTAFGLNLRFLRVHSVELF